MRWLGWGLRREFEPVTLSLPAPGQQPRRRRSFRSPPARLTLVRPCRAVRLPVVDRRRSVLALAVRHGDRGRARAPAARSVAGSERDAVHAAVAGAGALGTQEHA